MGVVYNIIITVYTILIRIVSPFNEKARQWVRGRKGWQEDLKSKFAGTESVIWVHCASLGEFEQGRPVIEMIKEKQPAKRVLVTFFSPSGYEIMKKWPVADHICYLPADTPSNAARFIDIVKPEMVIFIKYEFWNNFITAIHKRDIPLYLVSAIFRPGQYFFRWYGNFFRTVLNKFSYIFAQDHQSEILLKGIGINRVSVAGDTRFDRVTKIATSAKRIPIIEKFKGTGELIIVGSSWYQDELIISRYINNFTERFKWIFAPHEIEPENISRLERLFRVNTVRYSDPGADLETARVLIIDNIGLLSSAYRYGHIAIVGGGFGDGIHNILEPACWGIPVMFGPNHNKFREAEEMKKAGAARAFISYEEFEQKINEWIFDSEAYLNSAAAAGKFVKDNTGATELILAKISQ